MADLPITGLPANTALTGAEIIPAVQGGTTGKSLISAVGTYVRGLFTTTPATIAEGGTNAATASGARTALGLAIGSNVQAWDADLDTLAANGAPGATGLAVLLAATAAAARTTLGAIADAPSNGTPYVRNTTAWQRTFLWPGYLSGSWYGPDVGLSNTAGVTVAANAIYMTPFILYGDVTITDLGAEITTVVAASNFQLAIYAMDPTTKFPTGPALASTASMSGATATQVSSTLASPVAFGAGMYWAAINSDSAVAIRTTASTTAFTGGWLGSPTLSEVLTGNSGRYSLLSAQTFGTWPNLTSATITRTTTGRGGLVYFKAQ